jgi:hypothetical protein
LAGGSARCGVQVPLTAVEEALLQRTECGHDCFERFPFRAPAEPLRSLGEDALRRNAKN